MIKCAVVLVFLGTSPVAARDILLAQPIECELGRDCFVQNYVDADAGPGAADFTCGPLSYDAHTGTDFSLTSLTAMENGVNVLAASPGRVQAVRNNIPDGAPPVEGVECGNGVLINHGGDWVTQYCHMKAGSVSVVEGQRITMGTVLGQVGLSGYTEFPHLHFEVRYQNEIKDPFNRDDITTCISVADDQLWQAEMPYQPGGIISTGMTVNIPEFSTIKAGEAALTQASTSAPALVIWTYLFGSRAGDIVRLSIKDGGGLIVIQDDIALIKDQAQLFRAIGRRLPDNGWPVGVYTGEAQLLRAGKQVGRTGKTQIIIGR